MVLNWGLVLGVSILLCGVLRNTLRGEIVANPKCVNLGAILESIRVYLVGLILILNTPLVSGQGSLVKKPITIAGDTTVVDTGIIVPGSFVLPGVAASAYRVVHARGLLVRHDKSLKGTHIVSYRVLTPDFNKAYYHKDTSLIGPAVRANNDPFRIIISQNSDADFFGSGLNKTGSISRGATFGNNQNLSVNSNLNLQMSGKIAPDVSVLMSVTDDNIPIQPEGNTQQLQDFDQVYIKVFDAKKWELVAGDFWLKRPRGYFMQYYKRAQGGSFTGTLGNPKDKQAAKLTVQASGAISKGKFARNRFFGVEGNQGPYRLTGAENEPFIIILSGTERVYIDGRELVRGQENDYVIDYNTAEITFTPRNLITKDRRIVVEFQYSDKNYARSLFQVANLYEKGKWKIWLNAYSEQDSKNQPLQITLSDTQQVTLANAGDDLGAAFTTSIDTANFSNNRVLYEQIDTVVGLTTYTILVYSNNQDSSLYKATFSNVGQGNGDYELDFISAVGRVYKWVGPDQGDHDPLVQLAAPNKQQMITSGFEFKPNKNHRIGAEGAYSYYDKNTFSSLDAGDNQGFAFNGYWNGKIQLGEKESGGAITTDMDFEFVNHNFQRIERFRAVEFNRNWNLHGLSLTSDQIIGSAAVGYAKPKMGKVQYKYNMFLSGDEYRGIKNDLNYNLAGKGWSSKLTGSYLVSGGSNQNSFLRHRGYLHKDLGPVRISYTDEHELNSADNADNASAAGAYQFYDYQVSVGAVDSVKNKFQLYFRQRHDKRPDSADVLGRAAVANHYGGSFSVLNVKPMQLLLNASYRELRILDTNRLNTEPENTLVGRVEHRLRLIKGTITTSTYYEIGSGLELKREFLYLEVQPGQGVYTWVDYDQDDVKDLNEFEIAAFQDQANYIRVFTPTNEYVKTFTNQFNQSLFLKPAVVWRKEKGFKRFVARFSDQLIYRVDRKTNSADPGELYNPFLTEIADTALISVSSSLRNTLFFNRTSPKFGMDYSYQGNTSKTLLTSGFDSRLNNFHETRIRWNLSKQITVKAQGELGRKRNVADYVSGRNYDLDYVEVQSSVSYQPNVQSRYSLQGTFAEKRNDVTFGGEYARIIDAGAEVRYNVIGKGSLSAKFNFIYNTYTGEDNTTLAYEMLEALKEGQNYTWNVLFQRAINDHLQLNLNYNGRKSPGVATIHTGGVQVRALF